MKFLLFFICFSLNATIKVDSTGTKLNEFSYKDFCQTMNAKNPMLISASGLNELECFNQQFNINEFCLKKLPGNFNLSRGFANEKEQKVYCEEASTVSLMINCSEHLELCKASKNSCEKLQKIYANNLELSHYSNVNGKLNCYFTKMEKENLNEL